MWLPFGRMILAGAADEGWGDFVRPLLLFVFLCMLFVVLFLLSFRVGQFERDRIRCTGLAANATVLGIRKTGISLNDRPLSAIDLEVQPPGAAPFRTTVEYFISEPAPPGLSPGGTVQVFWREGTREVAIDGL